MLEIAIENVPENESAMIEHVVMLTIKQLERRYGGQQSALRGVHAKSHGCVKAQFHVLPNIADSYRHGVFSAPGRTFEAMIRFSNAAVDVKPDSVRTEKGVEHGSRGMAIKLLGVEGTPLETVYGPLTQDFLMINQPVFAFANVEDYRVLSKVLAEDADKPERFFSERLPVSGVTPTASQLRAVKTLGIVRRIRSADVAGNPPAFQQPPASPVDNDYFGAAPFLLGPHQVMRFRVRPRVRSMAAPNVDDPNYLRSALVQRLSDQSQGDVVFDFEVQVRPVVDIHPDRDIENASEEWDQSISFTPIARITIPLQEFDTAENNDHCEHLVFTPWHGLQAHRPLGGINRMRKAVYEASAKFRGAPEGP